MTNQEILDVFTTTGTMLNGHFILTSGRHSDRYMQCAHLFEHPEHSVALVAMLAEQFKEDNVDLVVSPAVGGIIVGYELARQLGVRNIFAERQDGKMTFRRDFSIAPGARVVVVEDVSTTGGTVLEVIDIVKAMGGLCVGVGLIVDRSAGKIDFGVPLRSVISMQVDSFEAEACPLCKQGSHAVKPGSRGLK